ncbi:hypothetical protein ANOM_004263 [Aspergillus nomiae NRRL 13137]|uniref:Uncharacterized protein n=1 Tax=Aspergillus nomiae NRRL (strain ATCC 15546 / NRRL 13137 / CBS 260.88 / M93) TaxID=1509407 RepID=A0A0L1J7T9_ASPN3|nr:uncharacterized protein ANOM_004263 [Aspergillus nomiae NRRL 13137]KNG87448.1 hypothetical protein ANOM_004263 [Aspergillus nomiae NRRL 13137]
MESTPRKPRKLNSPRGVHKSGASHNDPTRTITGQSSRVHKKQCVPAAQHRRATSGFQEDCSGVSTGHVTRIAEDKYDDPAPESSHDMFNLPLPRGIDHEVPRWAAVYSMAEEVMRFLPPQDSISDQEEELTIPDSERSHSDARVPENIAARPLSSSTIIAQGDTKNPAPALENEPIHNISATRRWNDWANNEGLEAMAPVHSGEWLDLSDIDALLRF